ncbi:Transposable element Tcb1 transposase [Anthophora quadrimaculata]
MSAAYARRFEAVFLCTHPKGPKLSYSAAARYMQKSVEFVRKWVHRYKATKNVDNFEGRGKKWRTTTRQDRIVVQMFKKNPSLSLRHACKILEKKGIKISMATINKRLEESEIKLQSTLLKPLLSERHVENRFAWAQQNVHRNWENIIFTDESSFWAWIPQKRAWSMKGHPMLQRTVKHPIKVHVWGCFCSLGFGNLYLFTDTLDAKLMLKIYEKCLLKSAKVWFGEDNTSWMLQEDNDPKHRSRLCRDWKAENGINVLEWPSQSLDANPIENVWAIMKIKLRGKTMCILKQLSRQIRKIWRSLPREYAENLVKSMPRRCEAILQNNGDFTQY